MSPAFSGAYKIAACQMHLRTCSVQAPSSFSDSSRMRRFTAGAPATTDSAVTAWHAIRACNSLEAQPPVSGMTMPSHLGAFEERTRQRHGDAEHLCRRHTLLSYYIPFRPGTLIQESITAMTGNSVRDLKFRLGLPASRVGASHPLKACPLCMTDDVAATGIAYWHLDHQFPSVWVCPKHGGKLMQCTSRTKTANRLQWVLPDMVEEDSWRHFADLQGSGFQFLQKLAQISCDAVRSTDQNMDPDVLRACSLRAAHERGWLKDSGRADLMAIREAFLERVSGIASVSDWSSCGGAAAQDGGFLGGMLRSDRAHKHPVKYLVLIALMFDDWDELAKAANECEPESDHHPLTQSDRRRPLLARRSATRVIPSARRRGQLALPISRAMYWARKDELPFERRPRMIDENLVRKIADGLTRGLSCEEIAHQTETTIDAVRRHRDTHADVRAVWNAARSLLQREAFRHDFIEVMRANPNAHQTQLRKARGSHFDWLRKHDVEWLAIQLPNLCVSPDLWDTKPAGALASRPTVIVLSNLRPVFPSADTARSSGHPRPVAPIFQIFHAALCQCHFARMNYLWGIDDSRICASTVDDHGTCNVMSNGRSTPLLFKVIDAAVLVANQSQ